eukprot:scaffold100385_cov64-Phaeocystis_antarctica.AAC.1
MFLSKDVKVINGKLTDPTTGKPLQVDSASTTVASDGTLRDRASNRAIATFFNAPRVGYRFTSSGLSVGRA